MHMKMEDQKKGLLPLGCLSCFLLSCLIAVSADDVPDGVVFTDLKKTVHQGDRAVLKCHFYGTPIAVYWKIGYDPTQAPNVITWVEGEAPLGSCVQDKACEMHEDFSLIINEVKIADQGRYICRVSNYLGILIHNFTDLNVFASPKEPYPVIEGCNSSRQSCVIHTIHPINITCSVYGYYPDVDLFMLHGANRLDILNIEEAVNDDGTKSKSISTRATVSETQYVCVASDIPGTTNQRTVTALVAPIVSNDTTASETPPHNSSFQGQTTPLNTTNNVESEIHVSHIVVPIVVILLTCFLLAFVFWKTHRHTKVEPADTDIDPESIPMLKKEPEKGNVSFYEIWVLLYNTKGIDMVGIRHVLTELGIEDVNENSTKWQTYSALCKWKDRTTLGDQAELIRDAFYNARYEEAWTNIERNSKMLEKASEGTPEKILRSIDDRELRNKFMNKLIPGRVANYPETPGSLKSISQQDMVKELKEWSSTTDNQNQMVLLSIALEDAGCCPVDRSFFTRTLSFYEIWCLLYNTKSTCLDIAGIRRTFQELGIDVEGDLSKQRAYTLFCSWKDNTTKEHQTMILMCSLEKAKLESVWEMNEQRAKMSSKVSEYICEKIMRSIDDQQLKNRFLNRLIPGRAADNPETPGSVKSIIQQDMVKELKEWSSKTDNENQMVLLSIALEEAECRPVDRTFFTGMKVSFFELWSVTYDGSQDNMVKLQRLLNTMGINGVNPTEYGIYKGLCEWKNKEHDDQMSLLRDELCAANLTDVWERINEQRANMSSKVSEYICEKIMQSIDDQQLKNRFLNRLIPGRAAHNPETPGSVKSIRQQDMVKELKEWSSKADNGNQMVLLSIALEEADCRPVDRTFFTGMKVSFFELWSVAYDGSQDNMMKLQRLLKIMGINDVNPTAYGIYEGLCEWRNEEHDDQMSLLRDELCAADLTDVWERINGLREKRDANVTDDTLSHILWHIQNPRKVEDLLSELIPGRKNQQISQVVTKESIEEATRVLRKWRVGPFQQNPFVLISLALETAGCIPLDREFFTVPDHLKKPISTQEVEACVHSLTGRHCRRLAKAAGVSDDKKISATINENTETVFDTKAMIRDWIDRQQCSHYEKRCRLTQAVIKIGRHDLINCFGVNDQYRSVGKDPGGLHPDPHQFSHESAYIDDVREIVSFLPKERRADFCKEMMISINKDGKDEKDLEPKDWENMITATNTSYEPLEKLVSRFQLTLTKANCRGFEVTDEELEITAEFINAANTELQPSQRQPATRIETNTDKANSGTPLKTATGSGNNNGDKERSHKFETSKDNQDTTVDGTCHADHDESFSETDVEGDSTHFAAPDEVHHPDTISEEIHGKDENEENLNEIVCEPQSNTPRSVSFMLKRWKSFYQKKETCHSELRKSLQTLGLKECIVDVAPAKYLYKVELLRIAFNLLMRDVLPFIDAVGMNPKQITEYIASSPELERGSLGLLQQLWKTTLKSDTHRRRDFCLALRNIGYEGLARSVYLDYEPSQSELNSTLSVLWNAERLKICTRLELSGDDQAACIDTEGQVNLVEVVRRWKLQIRPVPYHYRLEIGTCLRDAGRQDVADQILAGRKGKMEADENVLRNICRRLEADQITSLCKLLDLKTGQSQEESITSVINWVIEWINEFDPSSKKPKLPGSQHKLKHRKNINNKMFYLGCHELAEEIMHLEIGILSE